jgi:hypothetical protein
VFYELLCATSRSTPEIRDVRLGLDKVRLLGMVLCNIPSFSTEFESEKQRSREHRVGGTCTSVKIQNIMFIKWSPLKYCGTFFCGNKTTPHLICLGMVSKQRPALLSYCRWAGQQLNATEQAIPLRDGGVAIVAQNLDLNMTLQKLHLRANSISTGVAPSRKDGIEQPQHHEMSISFTTLFGTRSKSYSGIIEKQGVAKPHTPLSLPIAQEVMMGS